MANKNIFGNPAVVANTKNNAGGTAFSLSDKESLAQIAATNCFNGTYYASAEKTLDEAKRVVNKLKNDPEFVAKVAVYCRDKAHMKDMPAFLCAVLVCWGEHKLFRKIFPTVIDNGKMLRNFVQIGRSGQAGKVINMSSGTVRHAIRDWFISHNSGFIFRASIGNDPSMRDILRMARPKPENKEKAALYAYLKGAEFNESTQQFIVKNKSGEIVHTNEYNDLPDIVRQYEEFKKTKEGEIPNVDFRMLDSVLNKTELESLWRKQAESANWTTTRMNLNNFEKYGIFNDDGLTKNIADRLRNPELIRAAKAFPYQLMNTYFNTVSVPHEIKEALQDALEISLDNIPEINEQIYICVDVSGSMRDRITGNRGSVSTNIRCIDVASLFASAILRKNKSAKLMPFDTSVHNCELNGRDTVLTNAKILAKFGGGGTDCSLPLFELNTKKSNGNLVIYISDNESWMNVNRYYGRSTAMMEQWLLYKKRNPKAKLVCIDLTPGTTSQVNSHKDILNVGGFGDQVFDVINSFVKESDKNHWTKKIEEIVL